MEEGMMGVFKDPRVVRGPMGRLLSNVELNIDHLRSEFDGCAEKRGRERRSKLK